MQDRPAVDDEPVSVSSGRVSRHWLLGGLVQCCSCESVCRHKRKPHHHIEAVVGSYAILPDHATPMTTMDYHMLTITAGRVSDGDHRTPARTCPVTWPGAVHVTAKKASRTVIPVPPAAQGGAHHHATVTAAELISEGREGRTAA